MSISIYCDEAGHTGDGLRDQQQPYFAYAGVAVEPAEAAELVTEIRDMLRTSAPELKAAKVYNHSRGRDVCALLVQRLAGRVAVVVHEKAMLLAANFYEYVFEPPLSAHNGLFYQEGFHEYIMLMLYVHWRQGDPGAELLLTRFMASMRRSSGSDVALFDVLDGLCDGSGSFASEVARFARTKLVREAIMAELQTISSPEGHTKNTLDPSMTSVTSILRAMSEKYGSLQVVLDESKPLRAREQLLNDLGSGRLAYPPAIYGLTQPLNYTLAAPVRFASSSTEAGLQLADLVAGFTAFAWRDFSSNEEQRAERAYDLRLQLFPWLVGAVVFNAAKPLDMAWGIRHTEIFMKLIERAESGLPLVTDEDLD